MNSFRTRAVFTVALFAFAEIALGSEFGRVNVTTVETSRAGTNVAEPDSPEPRNAVGVRAATGPTPSTRAPISNAPFESIRYAQSSPMNIYKADEGRFIFKINRNTLKTCRTFERTEVLCIPYQQDSKSVLEKTLILSNVKGFAYDPKYSYVIEVERLRDKNKYGATDVSWYTYRLVSILEQQLAEKQ